MESCESAMNKVGGLAVFCAVEYGSAKPCETLRQTMPINCEVRRTRQAETERLYRVLARAVLSLTVLRSRKGKRSVIFHLEKVKSEKVKRKLPHPFRDHRSPRAKVVGCDVENVITASL